MKSFWKNKKVLVTGAAGFIGSHAVDTLLEEGSLVTAAVSPNSEMEKIRRNLGPALKDITLKRANLLKLDECMKISKDQDIVLNFAAMDGGLSFKKKYPAEIFRVNTEICLNMLEAARAQGVSHFLLMSSIEVYYPNTNIYLKENNIFTTKAKETVDGYSWSKRLAELAAKMYYKQYNFPVAIARVGNVYGPRDHADGERGRVIPTFITDSLKKKNLVVYGNGKQVKSFIYVKDLVDGLLLLTEKYSIADPVNIAGKNFITIKELAELIIEYSGNDNKVIFDDKLSPSLRQPKVYIGKMKRVIGLKEKTTLVKGLKETINFYKEDNL